MKKIAIICSIFSLNVSNANAQSLEDQMHQMELASSKVQETRAVLVKQIEQTVFKGYVDDVTIKIKDPVIKSVHSEGVEVELPVELRVAESRRNAIISLVESHIKTNLIDDQLWYTFPEFCYKNGGCQHEIKTQYSPVIWDLLSESALGLEISFLKQESYSILIGQELGVSGSVFFDGTVTFKFNVPKENITNAAKPTLRLVKYKAKWDLRSPQYSKILTYKTISN